MWTLCADIVPAAGDGALWYVSLILADLNGTREACLKKTLVERCDVHSVLCESFHEALFGVTAGMAGTRS